MYLLINFCRGSYIWVNSSGYNYSNINARTLQKYDILCKNTFGVKEAHPIKVESYLQMNAWTDWQQQDLILEYGQGLA